MQVLIHFIFKSIDSKMTKFLFTYHKKDRFYPTLLNRPDFTWRTLEAKWNIRSSEEDRKETIMIDVLDKKRSCSSSHHNLITSITPWQRL